MIIEFSNSRTLQIEERCSIFVYFFPSTYPIIRWLPISIFVYDSVFPNEIIVIFLVAIESFLEPNTFVWCMIWYKIQNNFDVWNKTNMYLTNFFQLSLRWNFGQFRHYASCQRSHWYIIEFKKIMIFCIFFL